MKDARPPLQKAQKQAFNRAIEQANRDSQQLQAQVRLVLPYMLGTPMLGTPPSMHAWYSPCTLGVGVIALGLSLVFLLLAWAGFHILGLGLGV